MSTISDGEKRPPQLDDPVWLQRMSDLHGQMWIALELHVSRKVVRKRLEHFGIKPKPAHRPRGSQPRRQDKPTAAELIPDLIGVEQTLDVAPSGEFVMERVGAWVRACYAKDLLGELDALLALASIAGIRHDHLQAVRQL